MSGKSLPVWLEASWADGRLAARNLVRRPVFALVAVITLALGIGANTAVFSVISAVFLRPLPYSRPERLVWSTEYFPNFQRAQVFLPEYAAWREHTTAFEHLEAYGISAGVNFAAEKQSAERVQAGHVTPGFFTMLGVTPQLGRTFREGETDRVTIISDPLWRGYFHADPGVLHRAVLIDGAPATIIGVMPRGFVDPGAPDAGVWLPDAVDAQSSEPGRSMHFAGGVIGRLKAGVTAEQARVDLTRIARAMDHAYPMPWLRYHSAASVRVVPLREQLTSSSKTAIFVLAGAVGFVLLI
ncbi:MAG TPA: ABC transporter permease, partial [Bryobacteraceae bacterium]